MSNKAKAVKYVLIGVIILIVYSFIIAGIAQWARSFQETDPGINQAIISGLVTITSTIIIVFVVPPVLAFTRGKAQRRNKKRKK